MDKRRTINLLNDLIRINTSAKLGYEAAAEHTHHLGLADYFRALANQRKQFVKMLNHKVIMLGTVPDDGFSVLGKLHRWLIDFKTLMQSAGDDVIIEECLRGDEVALQHYIDGMALNLPNEYHDLLLSQYKTIKEADRRLREYLTNLQAADA